MPGDVRLFRQYQQSFGGKLKLADGASAYATQTVALDATASSGLAVTYSVSGPATLEGTTLTCTGVGTVTVTASQSGNGEWTAAADRPPARE